MYTILLVIHSIIVIFLIALVLVQKTDADGMSGLSGGGGNQFLTGSAQANLLTRATAILATAFFLTSLTLAVMASHQSSHSILDTTPATPTSHSLPLQNKAAAPVPEGGKSTPPAAMPKEQPKPAAPVQTPSVPKPE